MSLLRPLLVVLSLAVSGTGPLGAATAPEPAASPSPSPSKSVAPSPLPPRFQQVRDRIDALFQHRNAPPPELDARANPFRPPGTAAPASLPPVAGAPSSPADPPTPEPAADLAVLQQAVATLRVSGVAEVAGRQHLVINSRPYKEGDVIQTQVKGESVYLRVRTISRYTVTLTLNAAEMTLKF